MKHIASNIRHLRQLKSWSQEQLADKLDITRARIGSYEEERCDPPIDILIKLSKLYHIAIDALICADLRKFDLASMIKVGENRLLFPIVLDKNNNDLVEVVTVKASAGYLNGYADPEYFEKLPNMNLPFKIIGKHRAFPSKFLESIKDIKDGSTYVLVTRDEGIVYKRVYKKPQFLELHSDNRQYEAYKVKHADVLEIWEFVCTLNISDTKTEELNIDSIIKMLNSMRVELGQ